jgi:hypothetical protein
MTMLLQIDLVHAVLQLPRLRQLVRQWYCKLGGVFVIARIKTDFKFERVSFRKKAHVR